MQGKEESEPFWSSWFSGFGVGPLVILAGIAIVGVLVGGTVVASVYISKEAEKSMKAMEENTKVLEATFKMQQELSKAVEKQAEAVLDACKANKYSPEECKSMMDSLYQWGTTQGVLINQAALQSMKATGAAVGSGYSPEAAAPGFFASLGSGLKWGLILAGVGAGSIAAVKLYKTIKE
jgi:protoheme ferro-lyase